jgi:type II secretion system-associated lipoprotein
MNRILIAIVSFMLLVLTVAGCKSFVEKEEVEDLRSLEEGTYILLKDLEFEDEKLRRGTRVKLIISADKDWIKVYARDATVDPLEARRFLLLYMFEDQFPEEGFKKELFMEKLKEQVRKIN